MKWANSDIPDGSMFFTDEDGTTRGFCGICYADLEIIQEGDKFRVGPHEHRPLTVAEMDDAYRAARLHRLEWDA